MEVTCCDLQGWIIKGSVKDTGSEAAWRSHQGAARGHTHVFGFNSHGTFSSFCCKAQSHTQLVFLPLILNTFRVGGGNGVFPSSVLRSLSTSHLYLHHSWQGHCCSDLGPPHLSGFDSYNIFFEFPMSLALIKLQKPCGDTPLRQSWVRSFLKGRGAFCCIMWAAHLDPC